MLRRVWTSLIKFNLANIKDSSPKNNEEGLQKVFERKNLNVFTSISSERKKQSQAYIKKYKQSLPALQQQVMFGEHLCQLTMYMKQDEINSQYMYALMNYQELGFSKASDFVILNTVSKYLKSTGRFEKKKQVWPVIKFNIPMQQSHLLVGVKEISDFLSANNLITREVEDDEALTPTIQKYINQNLVPHLESLFWHPTLNREQLYHVTLFKFKRSNINYRLVYLAHGLMYRYVKSTIINTFKIITNRERYAKSRENIQKTIQELTKMMDKKQFIGGSKPSHLDFYLLAVLNTKLMSKHFEQFLRKDIGGDFWKWLIRMRSLTQYNSQRVTLI